MASLVFEDKYMQLSCISELDEVVATTTKLFSVMAHLKAPSHMSDERSTRAPIVISAVLDRSGSMAGSKLSLVLKTMQFVVQNMKAEDQLGIVSYDNTVVEELPLTKMTPEGRQKAVEVLQRISPGGCTNLSGGLFKGINQIETASVEPPHSKTQVEAEDSRYAKAVVASVWLFTDGLANAGITDTAALKRETQALMAKVSLACSLFTFGFGGDHDSNMLRDISGIGNGMYYYIETEDKIPDAFSDCLGGLLSVAAQNLHLTVTPTVPSVKVLDADTAYRHEVGRGGVAVVHLPDIYSEEARDIIFYVRTSSQDPPHDESRPILTFALQYFNVLTCAQEDVTCTTELRRPAQATPGSAKPVPAELDKQRNRILCTSALADARQRSEAGNLTSARDVLRTAIGVIESSSTSADSYCQSLLSDLRDCLSKLQDQQTYTVSGSHSMISY